jgi:two-component system OmpR family sensor kinase
VLIIEVSDNGPGIALEEQARIFDLMYRSPHHRNLDKGMGIGLALSKRLVEAHGGVLTVQSAPGQGATFRIALPIEPPVQLS